MNERKENRKEMGNSNCIRAIRPSMGSFLHITLFGKQKKECQQALNSAFEEVQRLEDLLSPFKPDSELSKVNRLAAYGPVRVQPELLFLIQWGLAFNRKSKRALDITIGPLMKLWGFRISNPGDHTPSPKQIRNILRCIGPHNINVDMESQTVQYQTLGVKIEFGALGKGFAIDRATQVLRGHEISNALVSFGSTAYAMGSPPDKEGWRVAIRHPRDAERTEGVINLKNCALSTSGDYEQGLWRKGVWHNHIIDPRNGTPTSGVESTTVTAKTALEADACSTAALVLGPEDGLDFLEKQSRIEGMILYRGNEWKPSKLKTTGWNASAQRHKIQGFLGRRQFVTGLLGVLGCLFFTPRLGSAIVYMTPEEAVRSLISNADAFQEEQVTLTQEEKNKVQEILGNKIRNKPYSFWIGMHKGIPVGHAVLLNVIGKERPITFMVGVDPEGKILGVEVLIYRESQGSEIRSKRFIRQFKEKTLAAPLKLGRDVDSISGATLSSRSTAYAVKKALALVKVVYLS